MKSSTKKLVLNLGGNAFVIASFFVLAYFFNPPPGSFSGVVTLILALVAFFWSMANFIVFAVIGICTVHDKVWEVMYRQVKARSWIIKVLVWIAVKWNVFIKWVNTDDKK